jgi:hypothetical protein
MSVMSERFEEMDQRAREFERRRTAVGRWTCWRCAKAFRKWSFLKIGSNRETGGCRKI